MYAIVEIAGQQFKVSKGMKAYVHRLDAMEGSSLEFGNVLLIGNGDNITVGSPSVDGARIAAKVIAHVKGDKVIVFKKKRRKGYQKSNGHRQQFSQILIQGILGKGETLKAEDTAEAPKKTAKPKKEASAETAEAAPKKTAAKKTAPKAEAGEKKAPAKRATKKKSEE
jgi:large subunit ribosomal protein L21